MTINNLLNQTLTLATKSGFNEYGRPTTSTTQAVICRFQLTRKEKLLPNGATITIEAKVYLPGDTSVSIDDKVTFGGVDYKVYGVYPAIDGLGKTDHIVIDLIKWQT